MEGVNFITKGSFSMCCIEYLSDELKSHIRANLTRVCHGKAKSTRERSAYKYKETLNNFWDRYESKPEKTRIGILGELLSHLVVLSHIPQMTVVSPLFNLEEKSIKKGFDIVLYDEEENEIWITEVKSGMVHTHGTCCSATSTLLTRAKDDLRKRLNEDEYNHWHNAINAASIAIENSKTYKDAVVSILEDEMELISEKKTTSTDNNVLLVGTLFHDTTTRPLEKTVSDFSNKLASQKIFKKSIVLALQKGTIAKLEEFLKEEMKEK